MGSNKNISEVMENELFDAMLNPSLSYGDFVDRYPYGLAVRVSDAILKETENDQKNHAQRLEIAIGHLVRVVLEVPEDMKRPIMYVLHLAQSIYGATVQSEDGNLHDLSKKTKL